MENKKKLSWEEERELEAKYAKKFNQTIEELKEKINNLKEFHLYEYRKTKKHLYKLVRQYFDDFTLHLEWNSWGNLVLSIDVYDPEYTGYLETEFVFLTAVLLSY